MSMNCFMLRRSRIYRHFFLYRKQLHIAIKNVHSGIKNEDMCTQRDAIAYLQHTYHILLLVLHSNVTRTKASESKAPCCEYWGSALALACPSPCGSASRSTHAPKAAHPSTIRPCSDIDTACTKNLILCSGSRGTYHLVYLYLV